MNSLEKFAVAKFKFSVQKTIQLFFLSNFLESKGEGGVIITCKVLCIEDDIDVFEEKEPGSFLQENFCIKSAFFFLGIDELLLLKFIFWCNDVSDKFFVSISDNVENWSWRNSNNCRKFLMSYEERFFSSLFGKDLNK